MFRIITEGFLGYLKLQEKNQIYQKFVYNRNKLFKENFLKEKLSEFFKFLNIRKFDNFNCFNNNIVKGNWK